MKLAPVFRAFALQEVQQIIVHTGQHYDFELSEIFRQQFDLPKTNYQLAVQSDSNASFSGLTIVEIDKILHIEKPDLVLIYGDTNSTAAGAIAAAKNNILLAHVEAGLREFDKSIPEEINKLLSDSVSDLLFAPTQTAYNHLVKTGRKADGFLVGDTGFDLLLQSKDKIDDQANLLKKWSLRTKEYIFMTCHRAANTDKRHNLESIVEAILDIKSPIIWPLHPRTKKYLIAYNLWGKLQVDHIKLLSPIGYFETQFLLSNAASCITDSGGIIKEAYFHKVPSIIIDKQTEWKEIVEDGWTVIAGPNTQSILKAHSGLVTPDGHTNRLGDGKAGQKIADICLRRLSE